MKEKNKKVVLSILVILDIISFSINIRMMILVPYGIKPPPFKEILKVARTRNPLTMDPCDSCDSTSNDMLDQIVETLLAYNLSDPEFPLIGRLAKSWYWADNITITFLLRQNVFFHDGSKFTADCVLHTFERINFFGNATGTLTEPHHMAAPHLLYKFRDDIPIFNHNLSFKTDNYNVSLVLNAPFGPAEELLTYTASAIVHPDSTPVNEMLDLDEDLVIGTGPFKLVNYIPNSEIRFERWDRYWREPAYWDEIVYVYYRYFVTANSAMLAGDVDYLGKETVLLKENFEASLNIIVTGNGTSNYITDSRCYFISIKSEWVNRTWRKAISHALNYSYLVHYIFEETVLKPNSLIPPGFLAHNTSIVGGTYNIPYARQLMQKMGYGYTNGTPWDIGSQLGVKFTPGADESLWKTAAFIPNIGIFSNNYWNISFPSFFSPIVTRFEHDMDLIGIKVLTAILMWDEFKTLKEWNEYIRSHHFILSHTGDELYGPFSIINRLINPKHRIPHPIDEAEILDVFAQFISETNTLKRYEYCKKLQFLIHDKYFCIIPLFYDKLYYVHTANLKGFPYNCMRNLYWYPTYRE